jgi:hypothetical protein
MTEEIKRKLIKSLILGILISTGMQILRAYGLLTWFSLFAFAVVLQIVDSFVFKKYFKISLFS